MLKAKKGFSLIELLVVIAIIGVLSAVGITAYSGYTADAKAKVSVAQHKQVVSLLNAESAKCASGSGDFIWVGSHATNDSCAGVWTVAAISTYVNLNDGGLGMQNPYTTADASTGASAGTDQGHIYITQTSDTKITVTTLPATGGTAEVNAIERY